MSRMDKTKVLLITSPRDRGWLEDKNNEVVQYLDSFANSVNNSDPDIQLSITSLDRLEFSVAEQLYIYDTYTGKDLESYDIVHLRGTNRDMSFYADFAKAITLYVESKDGIIVDPEDTGTAFGKLSQAMLFALNGIPTPHTYSQWHGQRLAEYVARQQMPFPVICKASMGTQGEDNYLVGTQTELDNVLANTKEPFVVQNCIPNNGDYRVLLLGKAEPFVFWRPRIVGSHLSNTSKGSVPSREIAIDPYAIELSLRIQNITGRRCVGVDIMQNHQTGEWVALEANTNPALATGAFNDDKAERYTAMIKEIASNATGRVVNSATR